MNLPTILNWIMKQTMTKTEKHAKKNNVELIAQVTGLTEHYFNKQAT